ncbi:Membrane protease YdiL, CAAX protease family [Edwardsiella anguillarum]|uniref:CPBP family intramembrane glutamic endopeptidase n=1 Tax=Edwardsiella TaxID=635 RepID=UPI00045C923C|nr:CPBP family intramembrane glutamic endopeptidase [Edwardsiella anguillarum]AKM47228.1 CAAX protease [Edwardsiella sp. EA181011]GAJ69234.1 CAAX amino terminal protease family protein [Edwardsiella piscicida]RFT03586.1 CPBP family intramembrane metalloprotease [Edwardsiella anguillarum]WHQ14969.1 CPBP family intramembrane metalloprotease [Edwardsiella anguillarum]BET81538.1 Membrane protease YdiL, CAAX protease family [Edwardsiella anguillarum]
MWWIMLLPPALLALAPRVAFLLAGCAVLLLAQQGFITLPAIAMLALMALLLSLRQRLSPRWRGISEIALLLGIIALYTHAFPGFHNPLLLDRVSAGPHSAPFTLYANLDKSLVPLLLLALYPTLLRRPGVPPVAPWRWGVLLLSVPALLLLAVALGGLRIEPHWPAWTPLFAIINLLFVSLAEEALFRGYLQQRLGVWLGPWIALPISAVLFGLSHLSGGLLLVIFATLAGIIYGLAWQWSGRLWVATLFHFALNMLHLLFFTYPLYQP